MRQREKLACASICYGLIVLLARLFNRGNALTGGLFVVACLALPWVCASPSDLRRSIHVRRSGWALAVAIGAGYLVLSLVWSSGIVPLGGVGISWWWRAAADRVGLTMGSLLARLTLAVAEEFFFRGFIQLSVLELVFHGPKRGLISRPNAIAAVAFGLAHLAASRSPGSLLSIPGGLALGWLVEWSDDSIWPSVAVHTVSNLVIAGLSL